MRNDTSFNYLTEKATKPAARWSAKDLATFHAFNPNGAVAAKRASDELVSELVDAGVITSGHLLTIGSLCDLYSEEPSLSELALGYKLVDGEEVKVSASKWSVNYDAENMLEKAAEAVALYNEKAAELQAAKAVA